MSKIAQTSAVISPNWMTTAELHRSWCDVDEHEHQVRHGVRTDTDCLSDVRTLVPGWPATSGTSGWLLHDEGTGRAEVLVDLPGADPMSLEEAASWASLLMDASVGQLRELGAALAALVDLGAQE